MASRVYSPSFFCVDTRRIPYLNFIFRGHPVRIHDSVPCPFLATKRDTERKREGQRKRKKEREKYEI